MTTKKVVKTPGTAITKFQAPEGYTPGINQEDVSVPLVLLVQPTSDMDEWKALDPKDVPRPGQFYNPTSGKTYNELKGMVIRQFVQVYTLKPGENNRSEIDKFSSDGINWNDGTPIKKEEFRWKESGDKFGVALKRFNYVVLLEGEDMPCIVRFKATSATNAKKLNYNLIKLIPSWGRKFSFTTAKTTNDKGTFYKINSQLLPPEEVPTQAEFDTCTAIWQSYENMAVKVTGEDTDGKTKANNNDDDLPF